MRSFVFFIKEISEKVWRSAKQLPLLDVIRKSESPAGFMALAGLGLTAVIGLNVSNHAGYETPSPMIETEVAASAQQSAPQSQPAPPPPAEPPLEDYRLQRNETLIGLLQRAKIARGNAHAAVNALGGLTDLRKLQRGQLIQLKRNAIDGNQIERLQLRDNFADQATVIRRSEAYEAKRTAVETIALTHLVEGTITDNLYLSAKREGLPDSVIIELIRMMSFNVDFEREIRQGDTFQVYFERRYAPDFDDMENGRILHVDLGLKRRPLKATWFQADDGEGGYFDESGESTRRALMKTPLDVAVVTSRYGKRKHPVLGYTRMHKGVDFRAPTGTPIMAAGDGVIEMAARNGSYGNYVRIKHNGSYKTAYGHLSKFGRGIKRGQRVKQGQIIGYSGATGRVTAAHLHYEVLVGGKQTNPLTLKLPTGRTLKGRDLESFRANRASIVHDIDRILTLDAVLAQTSQPIEFAEQSTAD
ncbi:MAG: peptidoglycan DD-metalloendopeptidase family protein [Kordiimonadaceae bacterium]|nr:peptidoglycan DD-metalloendopeptidase family protein [Kordiimonadaceae bacterium]MBO6568975.1 peptidoglycan DD-metalloendopeptidase family protein [Kordiimonadaceae bacterium]MBO6965050.1 peptidoglycan DD-metalloendopeptidase family protein [Kordiimonadaceae bacterium]